MLGCKALFREQVGIGYRLGQRLSRQLTTKHLFHAGLCSDYNHGITSAGLRLGFRP